MRKETGILRIECQYCKHLELMTLSRGNVMKAAFKCAQYKRFRMSLSSYVFKFQCFRFEAKDVAVEEIKNMDKPESCGTQVSPHI